MLGETESIIDERFMAQLLQHGMGIGIQQTFLEGESLMIEARVRTFTVVPSVWI